ncbi:MAG: CoA transferase [Gammaproteobacteria bacterium]|nr:CoA transferase [Gammaproteobacteria bacterium]MBI5617603.1 CoA transferase [Gammaproteobacteria bacterium]
MRGALEGIRVLDLTQVLAGPFCTMLLADHGADVIKIEAPQGDLTRSIGPFLADDTARRYSGYYQSVNRNKRGIVLDLKTGRDRARFLAMVEGVDVVAENFRVGVMDRLGLGYETLCARNPRLVYAAIRGFGDPRTGASPYAEWPAFDIVAQAMGGFLGITGPGVPMKAGPGIGDLVPGMLCAFGILAAVRHAERTGEGQFLDVAMYDAMLALCERIVFQHAFTGVVPTPEGNDHPMACPYSVVEAADGWIAIACPQDPEWRALCAAMERPELAADPRYASNASRLAHAGEVMAIVRDWTVRHTKAELAVRLGGRVPYGPANDVAEIFADPHVAARGMLASLELPGCAPGAVVANTPIHFTATPGGVRTRAPTLGEHTAEVLREFGLDAD